MSGIFDKLVRRGPGATDQMIEMTQRQLNATLPEEYIQFVKLANGAEGFVGQSAYIMLWEIEDLASLNTAYQVQKYAPGLLIFGSDGGGEAYGFDTRSTPWTIVQVPFVGMDWSLSILLAETFDQFLERLRTQQGE